MNGLDLLFEVNSINFLVGCHEISPIIKIVKNPDQLLNCTINRSIIQRSWLQQIGSLSASSRKRSGIRGPKKQKKKPKSLNNENGVTGWSISPCITGIETEDITPLVTRK